METRVCLACGNLFLPRPQNPSQTYCSKTTCQRERRRRWQQAKRASDQDYRDNQKHAQQAWRDRNPDYWREYRRLHPQYVEVNRTRQLVRNYKNRAVLIAKMGSSNPAFPAPAGLYELIVLTNPLIAKKNTWMVFLSPCYRGSPMHVP